jgi:hypothetical protein
MRKVVRIIGLGIIIWGLSLFWPEINQILPHLLMVRLLFGLSAAVVIYMLIRYLADQHDHPATGQHYPNGSVPKALPR